MELGIISYIFWGLIVKSSKMRLQIFLKDSNFDICFLQEHMLHQAKLPFLGKSIWKDGVFYNVVAEDGVHVAHNIIIIVGKGSLVISVSSTLNTFVTHSHATFVIHSHAISCGRAQLG